MPRPGSIRSARSLGAASLRVGALAAAALACTAPGEEIQLGPLFARHRAAGGGTAVDALGGAWLSHPPIPSAPDELRALRPLISRRVAGGDELTMHYLVPLGRYRSTPESTSSFLAPIFFYLSRTRPGGETEWDLVSLPGILWSRRAGESPRTAWFPFGGVVNNLFTFDRIVFALFPLYSYFERGETSYWNVLFPVFGYTRGPGQSGFRFWPIYADSKKEGAWRRRFWLWPILHYHREGPESEPPAADKFLVWPLFGWTRRGSYRAYSTLWPFFGFARDPRGGYWALDAPWPLVRVQRGGQAPAAEARTRLWPFFSHFRAGGLDATSYLWPIFHRRREDYESARRESFYALPFVQRWTRTDDCTGRTASFEKYWPFFQSHLDECGRRRTTLLALNPIQRNETLEFHYAWLWELYAIEQGAFGQRERALWGLWHRERDAAEERTALGPLLASRAYRSDAGATSEVSLLFGLLRFRTSERDGLELMRPSFPGPGWPLDGAESPRAGAPAAEVGT